MENAIYVAKTKKGATVYIDLRNVCAIYPEPNGNSFVYPSREACFAADDFGGVSVPAIFGKGWNKVDAVPAGARAWTKRLAY